MPALEGSYIIALCTKIFKAFELKIIAGIIISLLTFIYNGVYKEAMLAVIILVIFDLLTRIIAEKKLGKPIQSQKVFRTPVKFLVYLIMTSAAHLVEVATYGIVPIIDETMLAFLAVTEFISILENVGYMGYAVPQKLLNQLIQYKNNK
jgi:phage-related holin